MSGNLINWGRLENLKDEIRRRLKPKDMPDSAWDRGTYFLGWWSTYPGPPRLTYYVDGAGDPAARRLIKNWLLCHEGTEVHLTNLRLALKVSASDCDLHVVFEAPLAADEMDLLNSIGMVATTKIDVSSIICSA